MAVNIVPRSLTANVVTPPSKSGFTSALMTASGDTVSALGAAALSMQQNTGDEYTLGSTVLGADLLNQTNNNYFSDLDGLNFSGSLLYRHKFAKKGRTISLDVSNGYAPKKGESALQSVNGYFNRQPVVVDSLDQRGILDVNSWNVAGNIEYTSPSGTTSIR